MSICWSTNRSAYAGRCHALSKVILRQTTAQPKARYRIKFVLAKTLLRPQPSGRAGVHHNVAMLASQSGEAWAGQRTGRLEVEQLSTLCAAAARNRRDRVSLDGNRSGKQNKRPAGMFLNPG